MAFLPRSLLVLILTFLVASGSAAPPAASPVTADCSKIIGTKGEYNLGPLIGQVYVTSPNTNTHTCLVLKSLVIGSTTLSLCVKTVSKSVVCFLSWNSDSIVQVSANPEAIVKYVQIFEEHEAPHQQRQQVRHKHATSTIITQTHPFHLQAPEQAD